MKLKFISTGFHGVLDYLVAIALIVVPIMQGFGLVSPIAFWLPVLAGAALFVYSLMTDYSAGMRAVIPMKLHLTIDFIAAVVLIVAPMIFGFGGFVRDFFWVVGIAVVAVVLLTDADS